MRGAEKARVALRALLASILIAGSVADGVAAGPVATRPKTCLVLSGGGARGAAHIGVLKVLEELHVPIDCVVGTSMGAIVGAAWVSGTRPEQIERVLREARWDIVLGDSPERPRRSWRSKEIERARIVGAELGFRDGKTLLPTGAVVGQQLDGLLQRLLGAPITHASFDTLPIPFRAIATDIESGRMTVLDRGSLNVAVRASMSVPGAYAPQEIDGRLLVDGGLVRNLGIDVARSLGAQRVIAVNLGTPLYSRAEIGSLLGVTGQMINILTEQNVATSLGQLGPEDLLISPDLGSFSAANFAEAASKIEAGELAARAVASQLLAYGVEPSAYEEWRAAHLRERPPGSPGERLRVETARLERVEPRFVRGVFDDAVANGPREGAVDRAVSALYAMDDFQQVTTRTTSSPDGDEIVIEPLEKAWGPNYLSFGLTLSTDLEGRSAFTVLADHRATWLTTRGLEWRTTASLGQLASLRTELLQPIDARRRWLVGAFADGRRRIDDFFDGGDSVSRYRNGVFTIGAEARSRYATDAELRLGVRHSWYDLDRETGLAIIDARESSAGGLFLRLTVDRLDDWDFPRAGTFARLEVDEARALVGGAGRYRKGLVEVQQAFGRARHSLSASLRFGTSFGSDVPLFEAFDLGGFQNLSGFSERQILARRVGFARLTYGYEIGSAGTLAPRVYLGGSVELASVRDRLNARAALAAGFEPEAREFAASSVFIAADTPVGPAYLGAGFGEGGERAFYLFLGRP